MFHDDVELCNKSSNVKVYEKMAPRLVHCRL